MANRADNWRREPDEVLQLVRDFTNDLVDAEGTDEVLRSIAQCVQHILEAECVIYLATGDGRLRQRAAYGPKSPDGKTIVDPIELSVGQGIVGAAAATRRSLRIPDTRHDPRYVLDDEARLSEISVPIVAGGRTLGVIDSEHEELDYFDDFDVAMLEDIAAIASVRVKAALTLEKIDDERRTMEVLSQTDEMTGLGNRRRFEARLAAATEAGQQFSVSVLDLDRFKLVNDRLGHHQGDAVIRQMGEILRVHAYADGTEVARLGGDEFGLLRTGPDHEALDHQVESVIEVVRSTVWATRGAIIDIAVSAGVASGSDATVWDQADDALLIAKGEGGDRLVRTDLSEPRAAALRDERQWADRITHAIENNDFFLVGQEIIPLESAAPGLPLYELLLRYRASDGTVRTPAHFLDSAARFGMLEKIDGWVIRHSIEWLAETPGLAVSINVTPGSMTSGFVLDRVREALRSFRVEPGRLMLEVTEIAAIEDPEAFRRQVIAAQELGVRVSMDDIGSGWTSLAVVRDNPLDLVKIDGAWVREIVTDPVAETAVSAITACAHLLGIEVVAEWVEDAETLERLRTMGVEYVQGFYFGHPIPLADISRSALPDAA